MTGISVPPWTLEQVASLNAYQASTSLHPFTCGYDECRAEHGDPLFALPSGWACVHCPWRQFWAHEWMTDRSWMRPAVSHARDLFSSFHWPGPAPEELPAPLRWDAGRYRVKREAATWREITDRAAWLTDIKRRLGLVTIGDSPREDAAFPDLPVLVHPEWPPGCRCVLLGGIRWSPGCLIHDRPWTPREISNCDPGIPDGLEGDLRNGMITHHNGWHFNGHLWWDTTAGLFREEVFRHHVSQGTRSAAALGGLVAAVNDEFGWE